MTMEFRNRSYFADLIMPTQDSVYGTRECGAEAEREEERSGWDEPPLLPEPPPAEGEGFFFDPEA